MIIKNETLNTYPLFAHAQGHVHETDKWKQIVDSLPKVKKKTIPSDVTIVTFIAIDDNKMSLKKQLDNSKIKFINLANPDLMFWKNTMKIKYLSVMENINTPYVLCLDGLDVLLSEDQSSLIDRFKSFNCKLLYNASKLNYPPVCEDIENTSTSFKYLNAGAFIGEVDFVKDFYKFLFETEMYREYKDYMLSEQIRVRYGRKRYRYMSDIKVDTECEIFQTLNRSEFSYTENILKIIN